LLFFFLFSVRKNLFQSGHDQTKNHEGYNCSTHADNEHCQTEGPLIHHENHLPAELLDYYSQSVNQSLMRFAERLGARIRSLSEIFNKLVNNYTSGIRESSEFFNMVELFFLSLKTAANLFLRGHPDCEQDN
jgi:hypothetical protein